MRSPCHAVCLTAARVTIRASCRAVQDKTYLGVLEARSQQLAAWMRSAAYAAMMSSLFPPASLDGSPCPLTAQAVQQHELVTQQECQGAFEAVSVFETSHNLALQQMAAAFLQQRSGMVSTILEKGGALGLRDEVVHDAVLLLDRAGSTGVQVGGGNAVRLGLRGAAADFGRGRRLPQPGLQGASRLYVCRHSSPTPSAHAPGSVGLPMRSCTVQALAMHTFD